MYLYISTYNIEDDDEIIFILFHFFLLNLCQGKTQFNFMLLYFSRGYIQKKIVYILLKYTHALWKSCYIFLLKCRTMRISFSQLERETPTKQARQKKIKGAQAEIKIHHTQTHIPTHFLIHVFTRQVKSFPLVYFSDQFRPCWCFVSCVWRSAYIWYG